MVQSALADLDDVTALEPQAWLRRLPVGLGEAERDLLARAWERARSGYAGRQRASGEAYFAHAIDTATTLAELGLDATTLASALVHDLPELDERAGHALRKDLGPEIADLVLGVCRMHGIGRFRDAAELEAAMQGERAEGLRKMLLAMARDVRVVFIALAERLHDLRTARYLPEAERIRLAREAREIYAPLANRLGIWQVKWELEDLAFRYLEPDAYMDLARRLAERRRDREAYIEQVCEQLRAALADAGLSAEVYGRPKHIYSIYRKMQRKGVRFDDLYDLRAVRILVTDERACYAALGVVHGLWTPIPREFDDYIATPKENNYRSLHTAVVGPAGKSVEVQIRTQEMHAEAELGIAAHWRYKEGGKQDAAFERKIAWLRQLLDWGREDSDEDGDFVDRMRAEVFADRVYALTPDGDILDLPRGATALDFAYHIHTNLGHRCRGAKINGRIVQLTRPLESGDRVEILASREQRPSRDWINPELGYLYTSRARSKVRAWFRQRDHDKNVAAGRQALDRELRRLGLADVGTEEVARRSRYARTDLFLSALGRGEVTPGQIAALLRDLLLPQRPEVPEGPPERSRRPRARRGGDSDVTVEGVGDLLTRMARCCNPAPGDPIVGFITRGSGVTIHRQSCPNVEQLRQREPERLLEVDWRTTPGERYPVHIHIRTGALDGSLSEITRLCSNEGVHLEGVQTHAESADGYRIDVDAQVSDVRQLSRLMARLAASGRVEHVWRGG